MFKPGSWINRKRHNRGFGIQSPSAFFFVTQVLKERLPYYAYEELDTIAIECGGMNREACRRLFRIANEAMPANAIIIGSVTAACAISSAHPATPKMLLTERTAIPAGAARHLESCNCGHMSGDTMQLFEERLRSCGNAIGILYIGECHNCKELLDAALKRTNKDSIIIVEGINRSKEHKEWWQQTISDPRTIVTYDLYSMGILFFNDERQKQNYTLKL
ncbi:MAG: hypothetical protein J6K83_03270 [Bacteroidaceae bacterium]|nr:hypothetical protein [Bacteroidaceae bacterium]